MTVAALVLAGAAALGPCEAPAPAGARCARVTVAEDRAVPGGRRIGLHVLVWPAAGPGPRAEDAVFYVAGGPGQAASGSARRAAQEHAALRPSRDLVLVDQRGTGRSNGLPCLPFAGGDVRRYLGRPTADHLRRCRDELARRADLRRYTTAEAVDDLEEVRRALGYPRLNLDAGSYGTRVALEYMRRYPDRVRTAVLRAVNPPGYRIPLPFAAAGQRALDRLLLDCEADAGCRADFPRLRDELAAVFARLEKGPVPVEVTNPATGARQAGELTRDTFAARLHLLLFAGPPASRVPLLVHRAAAGDFGPFADLAAAFGGAIVEQIDFGMQMSVLCAEDAPFITDAAAEAATRGTFLGMARVRDLREMCRDWPRGRAPRGDEEPVSSDVPTLLVSGALDPVTPPEWAERAARGLRNARHLVVEGGSHVDGGPCLDALASAFIAQASADGLDTSCLAAIRRPPFARKGPAAP